MTFEQMWTKHYRDGKVINFAYLLVRQGLFEDILIIHSYVCIIHDITVC